MQALYTILRNNQTLGPFAMDELAVLQVNENDLVWEEGRSIKWNPLYEIHSLSNLWSTHFTTASTTEVESLSGDEEVEMTVKYSRSFEDIKADFAAWQSSNINVGRAKNFSQARLSHLVLIMLVFLSMLLFTGTYEPGGKVNRETASLKPAQLNLASFDLKQ